MPCCCAVHCSNNAKKGYRLFRFPLNDKRKALWLEKINRKDWIPTKSSKLCEVHFDASQFENNRVDGRRLLKWNAVPTLFSQCSKQTFRKSPKLTNNNASRKEKAVLGLLDHKYSVTNNASNSEGSFVKSSACQTVVCDTLPKVVGEDNENICFLHDISCEAKKLPSDHNYNSAKGTSVSNQPVTRSSRREANKKKECNEDGTSSGDHGNENTNLDPSVYNKDVHMMCQIRLKKLEDEKESLQRRKYSLDHQVRTVKRKLQNLEISLSKFLNPDQILFLESQKKSGPQINVIWSEETVEIAFHILKVLGPKGYEFLKSALGYPLPAFRTLRRHKGSVQFTGLIPAS